MQSFCFSISIEKAFKGEKKEEAMLFYGNSSDVDHRHSLVNASSCQKRLEHVDCNPTKGTMPTVVALLGARNKHTREELSKTNILTKEQ